MISIELVHPSRPEPVQSWTFDNPQRLVRIGRSSNNEIALLSGVVSRNHAQIERIDGRWVLMNVGLNGCYIDDRPVRCITLDDGQLFRLGRTGPRLRIRIEAEVGADEETGHESPTDTEELAEMDASFDSRRIGIEELTTARETWAHPTMPSVRGMLPNLPPLPKRNEVAPQGSQR